MGALLSSLRTRCIILWFRLSNWLPYRPWWAGSPYPCPYQKPPRDVDKRDTKAYGPAPKRRGLLVGISYYDSTDPMWPPLETSHVNVDQFQYLLIRVYFIHRSVISSLVTDSYPRYLRILTRRFSRSKGRSQFPRSFAANPCQHG